MGSPRVDVVFRLWQCDKENHGWREGPPLTVPWQSFDLLAGPSPSRQNQLRTKKEYSFAPLAARSSIRTLAGLKRQHVQVKLCRTGHIARSRPRREIGALAEKGFLQLLHLTLGPQSRSLQIVPCRN